VAAVVLVAILVLVVTRPKVVRELDRNTLYAYAAGVAGAAGFLLYLLAVTDHDASIVSSITALYPIVPVVLGYALLKEKLTPLNYAGVALALVAVFLLSG